MHLKVAPVDPIYEERVVGLEHRLDDESLSLDGCMSILRELEECLPENHACIARAQGEVVRRILSESELSVEPALLALKLCVSLAKRRMLYDNIFPADADLAEDTETLIGFFGNFFFFGFSLNCFVRFHSCKRSKGLVQEL